MNPNKALWEKGDFTRISASMRDSGEAFVKSLAGAPGRRALRTASFKKATRPTCINWEITPLTSPSACLAQCFRQSRLMSPKRWYA